MRFWKKNSWIIEDQSLINTKNHASPLKTKLHIKFGFNSKKHLPLSAKFWQILWTIFLSLFNTLVFIAVSTLHTYIKEVREKNNLGYRFWWSSYQLQIEQSQMVLCVLLPSQNPSMLHEEVHQQLYLSALEHTSWWFLFHGSPCNQWQVVPFAAEKEGLFNSNKLRMKQHEFQKKLNCNN